MITMVILLPVLFALAALAVNLAYIQFVNTKLQIVTDAATRAAGVEYVATGDEDLALAAAQQLAQLNPVEAKIMAIEANDLEFGLSERASSDAPYTFVAGTNGNSVRLTTNAFADGAGDAVQPFFPIMGTNFDIRPRSQASHAQTTLDVVVVVDTSGSMSFASDESVSGTPAAAPPGWSYGDPVPPNSRWLDLVVSVDNFCAELDATGKVEKIGLVGYSSTATRLADLTTTYQEISDELDLISQSFKGGGTNIGDGITEGIETVNASGYARPWANKAMVLMSDGNNTKGPNPLDIANDAVAAEIPIYTVSFSDGADQTLMQNIADATGGTHYHAVDASQLNQAFRDIARRLPSILTQ